MQPIIDNTEALVDPNHILVLTNTRKPPALSAATKMVAATAAVTSCSGTGQFFAREVGRLPKWCTPPPVPPDPNDPKQIAESERKKHVARLRRDRREARREADRKRTLQQQGKLAPDA